MFPNFREESQNAQPGLEDARGRPCQVHGTDLRHHVYLVPRHVRRIVLVRLHDAPLRTAEAGTARPSRRTPSAKARMRGRRLTGVESPGRRDRPRLLRYSSRPVVTVRPSRRHPTPLVSPLAGTPEDALSFRVNAVVLESILGSRIKEPAGFFLMKCSSTPAKG